MCDKCKGTGLIPFKRVDGSVIPHTFVYCECYEPQPETSYQLRPEDFDYPMSSSFRGYSYNYCGLPDPGYISPHGEPSDTKIIYRRRPVDNEIDQLKARLIHLETKVNELRAKKKQQEQSYY